LAKQLKAESPEYNTYSSGRRPTSESDVEEYITIRDDEDEDDGGHEWWDHG
jgi:hypothetical protein